MAEARPADLTKSGKDLFMEVLRVYCMAEVEDYYKAGVWQDALMRTDIQLFERHRKEAGAPEPPEVDELEFPGFPKTVTPTPFAALAGLMAGAMSGAKTECSWCKKGECWTHGQIAKPAPGEVTAPADAELRLLKLFLTKWKLDEVKGKELILKRPYNQRRHIYSMFKTENTGEAAFQDLETFISECDTNKKWPVSGPTPAKAVIAKPVVTGVKRPLDTAFPHQVGPIKAPRITPLTGAVAIARSGLVGKPVPGIAAAAGVRPRVAVAPAARPAPAVNIPGVRPRVAVSPAASPAVRPVLAVGGFRPATPKPLAVRTTPLVPAAVTGKGAVKGVPLVAGIAGKGAAKAAPFAAGALGAKGQSWTQPRPQVAFAPAGKGVSPRPLNAFAGAGMRRW